MENIIRWVMTRMVASDQRILVELLNKYGYNVSIKHIEELDLLGSRQSFKLIHAVTNDLKKVFIVRVKEDGWVRIHLSIQGKNRSKVEELALYLEELGYRVIVDEDGISATLYTNIDNLVPITTRTLSHI